MMFKTLCLSAAAVLAALGTAYAEDGVLVAVPPTPPHGNTTEAQELAAWARAQARSPAADEDGLHITDQDVELLERWARSQQQNQQPDYGDEHGSPQPGRADWDMPERAGYLDPDQLDALLPTKASNDHVLVSGSRQSRPSSNRRRDVLRTAQVPGDVNPAAELPPLPSEETDPGSMEEVAPDEAAAWDGMWGPCQSCLNSGIFGGVEGLFLAPIGEPAQTVRLTNLVTDESYTGTADPGFGAGVRAWLGMQHCGGWGYRVRYTHFGNDNIDPNPPCPLNKEPAFNEAYHLEFDTVDFELTPRFTFCRWIVDASFGGRWARLERNASVVGYGNLGDVDLLGFAMGANCMEGTGLTFSLGGRRPFCFCNCNGWNLIGNFRGSVLWADNKASALTDANAVITSPAAASAYSRNAAQSISEPNQELFIAEAQLGLQYTRPLRCHPGLFFFRIMAEYQHWETGDSAALSDSFAYLEGGTPAFGGRVESSANAHDGDLDLIGFTIGAGITY